MRSLGEIVTMNDRAAEKERARRLAETMPKTETPRTARIWAKTALAVGELAPWARIIVQIEPGCWLVSDETSSALIDAVTTRKAV